MKPDHLFPNSGCSMKKAILGLLLVMVFTVNGARLSRADSAIEREYARSEALSPAEAREEFRRGKEAKKTLPEVAPSEARSLVRALDARGAWITEIKIPNYADPCADLPGDAVTENLAGDRIGGISVRVFLERMEKLIVYYSRLKDTK